jgi:hypothetical protein
MCTAGEGRKWKRRKRRVVVFRIVNSAPQPLVAE